MELIDTVSYKSDQLIPFGLSRSREDELYCLATRTKAYISELIFSHHYDDRIFMEQSILSDLTTFIPSYGVPKNAANIFNKASKQEQQRLFVDFHLMINEMKIGNERIALSQIHWSPKIQNLHEKYYLAYLTNFGGCEIRRKDISKRSWSLIIHNVAKKWMKHCQKNIKYVINTFEMLENAIHSIQITAISWNNMIKNNKPYFSIITANGMIAFFEIDEIDLRFCFQKQINCKHVQSMQWYSFDDKNNCYRSYVIVCELSGTITLLLLRYNDKNDDEIIDVEDKLQLFNEHDDVFANGIQLEYCNQTNQLIVVACKGLHLFIYLIDVNNDNLMLSSIHYIGHSTINGESNCKMITIQSSDNNVNSKIICNFYEFAKIIKFLTKYHLKLKFPFYLKV